MDELKLKRELLLTYSEFKTYSPLPIETEFSHTQVTLLRTSSVKNMNILQLEEGHVLVRYFTGLTEAEFESRNSEEKPYSPLTDPSE